MTEEEIKINAQSHTTHYAVDGEGWYTYIRSESLGYVCPYSGLTISEYDLYTLDIKKL